MGEIDNDLYDIWHRFGRELADDLIRQFYEHSVFHPVGFQGQIIDTTVIVLDDVKALPVPEHDKKADSDEPLR